MKYWEEFCDACEETIIDSCKNFDYLILGLQSEIGEVAGKVKKFIRGDSFDLRSELKNEIGDCLWYAAMLDRFCIVVKDDCESVVGLSYDVCEYDVKTVETGRNVAIHVVAVIGVINPAVQFVSVSQSDIVQLVNYLESLAGVFGLSIGECADAVIKKLQSRKKRNVIHGNGDNR